MFPPSGSLLGRCYGRVDRESQSQFVKEKIELCDIMGVMVLDNKSEWVTVDLDQWPGNG
jgi:hypothetical protein